MTIQKQSLLLLAAAGLLLGLRFTHAPSGTVRVVRPLMGTTWVIEAADHGNADAARHAIDSAFAELERIDRLMSEWKPDSPISQVNAAAGKSPVEVPVELRELLERSIRYGYESQGTFDITWRGMGKIWRFDDRFVPPTPAAVAEARKRVDFRRIQIHGNRVFLPAADMSIGLGGIAKGYAIDRATAMLAQAGFHDSLVDGGGDVLARGHRADGSSWRLGIQNPRRPHGELIGSVAASNLAVVTSGDYERFRMVNGVRYHHLIDPRTGWPAGASQSVTVMAASAERAVVLAKPIFILGGEQGLTFARAQHVEVLIIDAQGRRLMTDGFARVLETEPAAPRN